jgi:UDP-glucose 4-epimerase
MSILITGGLGQVGSYLTEELLKKKINQITVLDNYSSNIKNFTLPEAVNIVKGDILDRNLTDELVSDSDIIIHSAAQVSVVNSIENPVHDAEVNILGTINLLNAAKKSNIKRFIYISSAAVYGKPEYLPIDEKHPTNPLSPYGLSKLTGEKYAMMFHVLYGLPVVCLRPFNIYSPRQNPNSPYSGVITKFIERERLGKPPVIFGDGNQTRDFVSVHDVVDVVIKCTEREEAVGEVFNVGTGVATTINELAKLCSEMEPEYQAARSGDISESYADISKLRALLGYEPRYRLENGIKGLL